MIELNNVECIRQENVVNSPATFSCPAGQIVCILGHSGVGKTTLLDAIRGDVKFNGSINASGSVFSVFQGDNQLFPWYTIEENFRLANADPSWLSIAQHWNLIDLIKKKPNQLSGGQRQRFVLIRALTVSADILLCDEPLNHLDSLTSKIIAQDFKNIIQKMNRAVIWITHDIAEAAILADKCFVMTKTKLELINRNKINYDYISKYLMA